jgi:uncharacterized membrane protein YkvA (DUF1232 family)
MTTTIDATVTLPAVIERNERIVRAGFWRKLRRLIGKLPFVEDLVSAYYCAMDPTTPLTARAVLLGAVAYFVLPIDAIPDAFAIFGFTDDAGVLATAIAVAGSNIRDAHRAAAKRFLLSDRA